MNLDIDKTNFMILKNRYNNKQMSNFKIDDIGIK